jgi:signal transduction histidine kinase
MKLFLKIFLWFLTAVGLMMAVSIFVTRTFQTEPYSRWERSARVSVSIYAGTAGQIYAAEGEQGLKTYLDRQLTTESIREIGVVSEDGTTSIGSISNLNEFRAIKEHTTAQGSADVDFTPGEFSLGAAPMQLPDGRRFSLLIKWSPPRVPSFWPNSLLGYGRLAGILLTAILVCYVMALYLTSPIRKIRQAAKKLADGDLSTRVATQVGNRRDELADLARDFDNMAERMESLITSQQRLTRDVSHELRSPLARMSVALEIAKQKAAPESQPILQRIETEAARLNEMISRLLMLSKLESGAEDVERLRIDLAEIVRDVAADADFEAQAKGKFVEVSSADSCPVMGSENLLRSAVENVLRNAVRYTADRTVVDVSLTAQNGHALLRISDHGGGVPEEELDNLFRPFYRVGEARERKTGGIGLGLAIAERAIKAHKGKISAKNTADGLAVEIVLDRAGSSGS